MLALSVHSVIIGADISQQIIMGKKIQKISNLKNPESFFQLNTIKGFKYIDKAGEIVNAYHIEENVPSFSMGLEGLVIEKPKDKIDILKITSQTIWAKFSQINSLDMIIRLFVQEASNIINILEVEKINRIGWRNYFIYDFIDKTKQDEYFKKLVTLNNLTLSTASFHISTKHDFKINLIIQPVIKNDEQMTSGVLFDVDIYQTDNIDTKGISTTLDSFRKYILDENDGLVNVLNGTFL